MKASQPLNRRRRLASAITLALASSLVPGPLLGDWLHQCLEEWLGEDGYIASIEYSNRIAVYTGDKVRSGGTVTGCYPDRAEAEVEVFILNEAGETVAPGKALVRFTGNW